MRKIGQRYIFSATDLCNFVACSTHTSLERLSFDIQLERKESDSQLALVMKKGHEHEQAYLEKLRASGKTVYEIEKRKGASPEEEAQHSAEVLRKGYDYVYQPCLARDDFAGYADFLVRVETPSRLGKFSYEVIDSKLSKNEKASHLIQLCFYSDLLADVQGIRPEHAHIYTGSKELLRFRLSNFFSYYRSREADFHSAVRSPIPEPLDSEPCTHCSVCHWHDHCSKAWEKQDHLSLVANITRSQRKKLTVAGITTVAQLANNPHERISGISDDALKRLEEQATLQVAARQRNGEPQLKILRPEEGGRGFGLLPATELGDLFYDIEGDPLLKADFLEKSTVPLRDGLEYLHGFSWKTPAGELHYKPFWALSKESERECYEKLIDFLIDHTNRYPLARIYHYSQYEISALKRLSGQYPTKTEKLDRLLREQKFVDLYTVVKQSIRVSETRYSIKNLERFYAEARDLQVKDGGASVVWFEEFLETGDRQKLVEIEKYNREDCDSTLKLRDWLLGLKEHSSQEFGVDWDALVRLPPKPEKKKKTNDEGQTRAEEEDARILSYGTRLDIHSLQAKKETDRTETECFREVLYYLADFFRREMKPTWWAFFDRKERKNELVDDPDCLGRCTLDQTREIEKLKKSSLVTYTFPPQETKLTEGKDVYDMASEAAYGSIHKLDMTANTVTIKLGPGRTVEPVVELSPKADDLLRRLTPTLDKFLDHVGEIVSKEDAFLSRAHEYTALVDILRKQLPHFVKGKERAVIVPVSADHSSFSSSLLDAAAHLDNSYLFIQGPPGTGKTYHGARLAVSLLAQNKRIGVTSNSHKAVHNFLSEVEKVAREQGVRLHGAKKSDKDDPRKQYRSETAEDNEQHAIIDYFDNDAIDPLSKNLIAGTAWTFARDEHHQAFDYLFVDEASQMSLAHLVVAGTSARNLILIGDPQQLPQPLQGQHPGELGLSPLEYLLGHHDTVPPEQGVFLDVCRRMHPDICTLLSNHIYEGRLTAHPQNEQQELLLPTTATETLKSHGIQLIPVDHDGNTGSSPEEVATIRHIYQQLLSTSFCDKHGSKRPITPSDILVIAPYNLQVNNLQTALGREALVGSIDLFQGREAPVVIVSMTTSNAEDTPRGLDFLFSYQRINVALSRAQALAIIVASPRLIRTKCTSSKQMELVNFFCAVAHAAGKAD
jgi:uncharacterized protein